MLSNMARLNTVNIRPGVNILSVLPHLNYKAWYALAEFVDNSIQSSISNRKELRIVSGDDYMLRVDIRFEAHENRISIYDNASGIAESDYERAFRPAEIPPDATGLSEFGMGMKSAACWFCPQWRVRTTALGENIERTVVFNIDRIVHDSIEELDIISRPVSREKHYTEISLENIRRFPKGRTIGKIREHIASIYRIFLRNGQLELFLDGESLKYEDPKILVAPSFKDPEGLKIKWKKNIDIDLGHGKSATGFVAIRETASTRLAGLALFRRNRLVLGSVDETYRPQDIFGHTNSFPYQRLFGEIHLKGFHVSHTKDGVRWEENEEDFLRKLHQKLSDDDVPILRQAREYRTKKDVYDARQIASKAGHNVAAHFDNSISLWDKSLDSAQIHNQSEVRTELPPLAEKECEKFQFNFNFRDESWIVTVELSYSDQDSDWLCIHSWPSIIDPEPRKVIIRIAMLHSFMTRYSTDTDGFEAVLTIAAAMALSEVIATEQASNHPSSVRSLSNEILKNLCHIDLK